ncbi:cytidine deaminase [Myxococcota bacterium]|nr:cytidine deaminase [Myxococcota bacterium]
MSEKFDKEVLIRAAMDAREKSYAPYSKFRVGAAVILADGTITTGINVENASYGLTVCAERHAIAAAVVQGAQPGDVVGVAIVADASEPVPPCGACRQVIAEFAKDDAVVVMHNLRDSKRSESLVGELLPLAFRENHFKG